MNSSIFVFFQYNEKANEVIEKPEFRVPVRAFSGF